MSALQYLLAGYMILSVVLVLGSGFTKGQTKQTEDGVEFILKPMFRMFMVIMPLYLLSAWWALHRQYPMPWWLPVLFIGVNCFVLARQRGTITLTPTAVTQRFWLLPLSPKRIAYEDVMMIQSKMKRGGRFTQVRGNTRVNIVHSPGHSAADEFRAEMEKRTGKRVAT